MKSQRDAAHTRRNGPHAAGPAVKCKGESVQQVGQGREHLFVGGGVCETKLATEIAEII